MRWLDGITDSVDMSLSKTLGDGEGQRSLACCSPWGHKESGMTEQLNNTEFIEREIFFFPSHLHMGHLRSQPKRAFLLREILRWKKEQSQAL